MNLMGHSLHPPNSLQDRERLKIRSAQKTDTEKVMLNKCRYGKLRRIVYAKNNPRNPDENVSNWTGNAA